MPDSTCLKCGSHVFEIKETSPQGSQYKLFFVQCAICGVPVSTLDYFNLGTLLKNQERAINNLQRKIDHIENQLRTLR